MQGVGYDVGVGVWWMMLVRVLCGGVVRRKVGSRGTASALSTSQAVVQCGCRGRVAWERRRMGGEACVVGGVGVCECGR